MNITDYQNSADAIGAARANLSPRQRELENLERYARGTQYDGKPNFFDGSVPLWDRAPCIVYPVVKIAIESNVDLVLGEARFPEITSNPGEDDGEAEGLSKDESVRVDRAIAEMTKRVRFRSVSRKALKHAQSARSVAGIIGVRNGHPFVELVRSRWCEPSFDVHGAVSKLEIRYPYLKPEKQHDGTWKLQALLYRRTIDKASDTTYQPLPAEQTGREPADSAWKVDESRTVNHKLGFCPVHWYAHDAECSTVADFDGEAIHEEILDEIQALDLTLSQRHRSALFCGDPQIIETGVEQGYNPSGQVGKISVPATASGGAPSAANPVTARYETQGPATGRMKSPGAVWQYEDANVKVAYLVLPPEALEVLDNNGADLRNKIAEALAVVLIDPQNAKFTSDMSGRAVEMLRSRQFDRCDQTRDDVGENWLLPVVKLLLRVSLKTDIKIPAVVAVRDILARFVTDDGGDLLLTLRWPTGYVKPGPKDEVDTTTSTVAARNAKLITRRSAVQKLAPLYGISNVDQAMEALEKESAEAAAPSSSAGIVPDGGDGAASSGDGAKDEPGADVTRARETVDDATDDAGSKASPGPIAPGASTTKAAAPNDKASSASVTPRMAKAGIHLAGQSSSGVTETVYQQLEDDFPDDAIAWVRATPFDGPMQVPIDSIDFSNADTWGASKDPEKLQEFVDKIEAGQRKPIILINEPNNEKLIIVDGHHRALAYRQLGIAPVAYVGHVAAVSGPWDAMHASQKHGIGTAA